MGLIHTKLTLSNPRQRELLPMEVNALADTGSLHLCLPEHLAIQLQLEELYKREVTTADGKKHLCSYVGPLQVTFQNRGCFTGALVLGDEVLLGAVPMEDMDIMLSPAKQSVIVNPDSPNIATSVVKSQPV
jgi:clan AA aspartic protease